MTTGEWLTILLFLATIIASGVAYFIKQINDGLQEVRAEVSEIKPKVEILWDNFNSASDLNKPRIIR
jgi:hypothetical protein